MEDKAKVFEETECINKYMSIPKKLLTQYYAIRVIFSWVLERWQSQPPLQAP
jgi:hypothetical protein